MTLTLSVTLLVTFVGLFSGTGIAERKGDYGDHGDYAWHRNDLIPAPIDNVLLKVAVYRQDFNESYPHAASNIDTTVQFHSAADVAWYLPRALTIALFSPFPNLWWGGGASPGADHMRLLAGLETAFAYLLLPGVLLLFLCRGRHSATTVVLIQVVFPLIVLALIVSNVGTLYRMRYGYWQILVGLGMIGWGMWLQHLNAKYRRSAR
jgi:hypothetical protein